MRFVSWLFSFSDRHYMDAVRYEKAGKGGRVFAIIIQLILFGITYALEFYMVQLLNVSDTFLVGCLLFILVLGSLFTSAEISIMYSIFGFSYAAAGTLDKWIKKGEAKRRQKRQEAIEKANENTTAETSNNIADQGQITTTDNTVVSTRKCPRWLDVFVGVASLVVAVGAVIGAVAIFAQVL